MILKNEEGDYVDKQGRVVNRKGYLVDSEGNVVDRQGKIVFRNTQLDSDEEIPGFYRVDALDEFDTQAEASEAEDYLVEQELKIIKSAGE